MGLIGRTGRMGRNRRERWDLWCEDWEHWMHAPAGGSRPTRRGGDAIYRHFRFLTVVALLGESAREGACRVRPRRARSPTAVRTPSEGEAKVVSPAAWRYPPPAARAGT